MPLRSTVKILNFCLCLLLMSACGQVSPSTETIPIPKQSIPFRITWTDYSGRGVAIQKIVDRYNQSSTETTIVLKSGDEDLQAIESLLMTNSDSPILVLPYRYVKYLGDKDLLSDLTNAFQADAGLFYEDLWQLGTVGDRVYGIPWLGHSMCLIYNKTLLRSAGVTPENITNLDTLVDALKAVEKKTNAKGIGLVGANHNDISWMVNQFVYGFGGVLVNSTGTRVAVNTEETKNAILFYKDVLGAYAQPSWLTDTGVEVMERFRKSEIAFEIQGVWGITDIEKNGKPFEVGTIRLADIGLMAEVGPMMVAIPASLPDAKRSEAEAFIRYLISEDAQEQIMDGEFSPEHDTYYPFRVPVRKDLAQSLVFQQHPQYWPFVEGFASPSIDVPVPKWQIVKDRVYAPGLSQVMSGEMTVEAFLQEVEEKGNVLIASE